MPLQRRRVVYSGRVQGVGFRATCHWLARGFDVVGYVRNSPDGQVELLVQGDGAEIDRFLDAISSELGGYIHDLATAEEPTEYPPLEGFKIRF